MKLLNYIWHPTISWWSGGWPFGRHVRLAASCTEHTSSTCQNQWWPPAQLAISCLGLPGQRRLALVPSQRLKMDRLQIFALLTTCAMLCDASKILGVATIGARSHTMNLVRIGHELAERGHNVTMLISQFDTIGAETLDARTFSGLHVIMFDGPPGIGTEAWASNFSRDPQKVNCG